MQSELVSIIVPAFNSEKYIIDCIKSVIQQTYKNIEIIVVNDGSTDNTQLLLNKIDDSRLRVINQLNSGASFAKNTGLSHAHGIYIQYLDSDDILSFDKIENQINALKGKSNSIAVCKTLVFSKEITQIESEIDTEIIKNHNSGLQFYKNLIGQTGRFAMVQPNAYLIPIEVIKKAGPWSTDFYPCPDEDGEYFSRILLCADTVVFTDGINYYRKDQNEYTLSRTYSLTRAKNQLISTEQKCLNLIAVENNISTHELLLFNVSQVIYQFGSEYPELINLANKIIAKWGFKKFKVLNNPKFNLLSSILGIRFTLKFLKYYRKFKH
jgi:glycosyltransferase involved in cell wall biosynthesis